MLALLKLLEEKKHLIDVFRYVDSDECETVIVDKLGEDLVLFRRVIDAGEFDGFSIVKLDSICNVRGSTRSLKRQKEFYDFHSPVNVFDGMAKLPLTNFTDIIAYLTKNDFVVSIHSEDIDSDSFDVGKVQNIIGDVFELHAAGTYGKPEKYKYYIKVDDVTRIDINKKYDNEIWEFN